MTLPILYSFKRCPYAIRARMALAFAKIKHIHREINLKDKHPIFLQTSPKGTVPVLILPEHKAPIDESYDIVIYSMSQHLPEQWLPVESMESDEAQDLYTSLNQRAIPAIRKIKYAGPGESIDVTEINKYLYNLDQRLQKQEFLLKSPSALDLLLFPNLRQLTVHDDQWLKRYGFHAVEAWLHHWTSHPLFKKTFVNQPQWQVGTPDIIIDYA